MRRPCLTGLRGPLVLLLALAVLGPALAVPAAPALAETFPDVADQPAEIQAAVDYVTARGYMSGDSGGNFRPDEPAARLEYARALVLMFKKQGEEIDPSIRFSDLAASHPDYRYANIAVRHGYIGVYPDGTFRPGGPHSTVSCMAGLVKGLGLDESDGPVYCLRELWPGSPPYSGQSAASSNLHLRYRNTRTWPDGEYPRGELAFSIRAAEQCEKWRLDYVRNSFNRLSCQSPLAGPQREKALNHAFSRIGYPYVWGGESDEEGGYDCSGLVYFVLRSALGYPMMRVADDQARDGRYPLVPREALLPGDPIFFFNNKASSDYVGHAGMYVGRGMFIHSTGSNAGVSVDYLSGYWEENFAWGRRVIPEPEPESFDTYLLLANPYPERANARVTYMLRDGRQVALTRALEPYSRDTVKVEDTLVNDEMSIMVESLEGRVVAERAMYFNYLGRFPGGHTSPGSDMPWSDWFLAEGCTAHGFDTFVLIQNPYGETANVTLRFMKDDGSTVDLRCAVTPFSRYTVAVDKVSGMEEAEFSTRVSSDRDVVVERSMYFDYNGIKEGHNSQGLSFLDRQWHFSEGYTTGAFDTYLLLVNPHPRPAAVTVTLMAEDGEKERFRVDVLPHARRTVKIDGLAGWGDRAFSIMVESDLKIGAERAMYFDYNGIPGGHAAVGCPQPGTEWFLAEGYTAGDFDTYILLSNPGEEMAEVGVRFMLNGGRFKDRAYRVAPHSRYTIAVDREPGLSSEEVSALVTSSKPLVVERSMYFRYLGKSGGSCSPAVADPGSSPAWFFPEGYTGR